MLLLQSLVYQGFRDASPIRDVTTYWVFALLPHVVFVSGVLIIRNRSPRGIHDNQSCALCGRPPDPQCSTCGYCLTGNTSGRCPECGTLRAIGAPEHGHA
jgi:hypothetical protein